MRAFATALHRRHILAWWVALAVVPAARANPLQASSTPLSATEARKWLVRIHAAALEQNYQGTLVFSANGTLSSARVAHFCEGQQSYERIEVLDGRMQQTYRHNDRVYTFWPQSRVVVVEERDPRQASVREVIEPRAEAHYEVHEQGTEHVAGREAQILLLSPRDENRYAQRLWIDSRTGLMLRADVLGSRHQVLESSAFSQVDVGVKARPQSVLQPMRSLAGFRQVRPAPVTTQLEAEGWVVKSVVPGFRLSSSARRILDVQDGAVPQAPVLQAVFSDGLTHVSLFVEAFDRERHKRPLLTQFGATHTLMQPHGTQWWITVMGDVPAQTLKHFHRALERRQ